MKEIKEALSIISDATLDALIGDLSRVVGNNSVEIVGAMAAREWRRRYPGTICPTIHRRTMENGGYPTCYTGPRSTVEVYSEDD